MEVDVQEPFECSECDFKTYSEARMIHHSETHSTMEENNYTTLDRTGPHLNINGYRMNFGFQIEEEQNIDEHLIDCESLENTHWNKNMKIEDIDIDECGNSYVSQHQLIEFDNSRNETDTLNLDYPEIKYPCSNNDNLTACSDVNILTKSRFSNTKRMINRYEYDALFRQFFNLLGLENSLEIHKYFHYFLEIKNVFGCSSSSISFHLIICKKCNFSSKTLDGKALIYNHVRIHSNNFTINLPFDSCLQIIYDYFVCTICHIRIMSPNDFKYHCQTYNHEIDCNVIVGVKIVDNIDGEARLLHFCEICIFASPKYIDIMKHLTHHTPAVVRTKYCESELIESKRHELNILNSDIFNHNCHNGGMIDWKGSKITEVDIDNTGKYIPLGWQRKVYQMGERERNVKYKVFFISPFGKIIINKTKTLKHLEYLEKNSIILKANVEEMDFSHLSHNLPELKKKRKSGRKSCKRIEVEVDNQHIYVPEGWQRKLFKSINGSCKGSYCIRYISPFNDEVYTKKRMIDYIKSKEKQGIYVSVDMEQLDFTIPYHLHKVSNTLGYRKKIEIQIDNTGKYIPIGWQRKVYQYVRSVYGQCKVIYIAPNGKEITCKREVLRHIKGSEADGNNTSINVDAMDFKISACNLPENANKKQNKRKNTKKVECAVDNTIEKVPEGWDKSI